MTEKFPPLLLSFLLISGYLVLNKKALYSLVQRVPPVPQSISLYKQEVQTSKIPLAIYDKYGSIE